MGSLTSAAVALCLLFAVHTAHGIKVKMTMRSEEDSAVEDEVPAPHTERAEAWEYREEDASMQPFIKIRKHKTRSPELDEDHTTTATPKHPHPNDMFFPLVYKQNHINSMFKFEGNWYTWSVEKNPDGHKIINYYYCNEDPKHCDEIGWEHIDAPPKCAFQIDSLTYDDHACTSKFGAELRGGGACSGADQTKVNDIVKSCGSRIRSLWKFVRAGRRPSGAAKPADVNSLICEDEEECFVTVEYRIHHDRITFSLHEPTRGQTFKSALKRDQLTEDEPVTKPAPTHRRKDKKAHGRTKSKATEGKGVVKERNDSRFTFRRAAKNKNRINDDISDDTSE